MKKIIVFSIFALLFAIPKAGISQPYSHYLDNSVEWNFLSVGADGINYYYSWFTDYIDGDTLINNKYYFKQYYIRKDSTVHVMYPATYDIDTSGVIYFQAIREDSLRRFYSVAFSDSIEHIYENFSLSVGDTFPNTNPPCIVYSIDTIFSLRRFKPQTLTFGKGVIEGIGKTGPLCSVGIESNSTLICYKRNGNQILIDSTFNCDYFVSPKYTSLPKLNNLSSEIHIFPNPAKDNITLIIPEKLLSNELKIFNIWGKEVGSFNLNSTTINFDITFLQKGIYILQITDGNKALRTKLCKI